MPLTIEEQFTNLIDAFLARELSAPEFEQRYTSLWRIARDQGQFSLINDETARVFDKVFTALDCYCEDSTLREEKDLDETSLRREVKQAVASLNRE